MKTDKKVKKTGNTRIDNLVVLKQLQQDIQFLIDTSDHLEVKLYKERCKNLSKMLKHIS
jgi:hypothetical protein